MNELPSATAMLGDFLGEAEAFLQDLPDWIVILLLFAPLILSLPAKSGRLTLVIAVANATAAYFFLGGGGQDVATLLALALIAQALMIAIWGWGLPARRNQISDISARTDQIERQMRTFLEALDRRTALIDHESDDRQNLTGSG